MLILPITNQALTNECQTELKYSYEEVFKILSMQKDDKDLDIDTLRKDLICQARDKNVFAVILLAEDRRLGASNLEMLSLFLEFAKSNVVDALIILGLSQVRTEYTVINKSNENVLSDWYSSMRPNDYKQAAALYHNRYWGNSENSIFNNLLAYKPLLKAKTLGSKTAEQYLSELLKKMSAYELEVIRKE